MPDYFDIRNYISITDNNQIKSSYIIKFDNSEMMQLFINYLNDTIKYSLSFEVALTPLLNLCRILVKDICLRDGRPILVWLSRATWIFSDDDMYDKCTENYNIICWSDFRQWYDYIEPGLTLISCTPEQTINNMIKNDKSSNKLCACECGSTDLHIDYLQISLPSGLSYQYSVLCQLCGRRGPKSDTEIGAIDAWTDFISSLNIKSNSNNVSPVDFINNAPKCKHCGKPLILTEGANYCIYCGERINLYECE